MWRKKWMSVRFTARQAKSQKCTGGRAEGYSSILTTDRQPYFGSKYDIFRSPFGYHVSPQPEPPRCGPVLGGAVLLGRRPCAFPVIAIAEQVIDPHPGPAKR